MPRKARKRKRKLQARDFALPAYRTLPIFDEATARMSLEALADPLRDATPAEKAMALDAFQAIKGRWPKLVKQEKQLARTIQNLYS